VCELLRGFEFLLDLLCDVYCGVPMIAGFDMLCCLKGVKPCVVSLFCCPMLEINGMVYWFWRVF